MMMNGADALNMTLYDYTAALYCWSKANASGPAELPELSADEVAEMEAEAAAINWEELEATNGNG